MSTIPGRRVLPAPLIAPLGEDLHGVIDGAAEPRAWLPAQWPAAVEWPATARAAIAATVGLAASVIVATNQHAPYDIEAGLLARALAATVPLTASIVAALAVIRPRSAYVLVLLLLPYWNVAQISWRIGDLQIISQTIFVAALALGLLLRTDERSVAVSAVRTARPWPVSIDQIAGLAVLLVLVLAALSTVASGDIVASATVLLHGVLEPAAMGLILIALRPSRWLLVASLAALGLAVALGGVINMIQTLPTEPSLAGLQADRLLFSRLTFFNVGLFGEMLSMALPLLVGLLLARHRLGLGGRAVTNILVVAVGVCLVSLFLTFSKSGWLAAAAGVVVVSLLAARTWRARCAVALTAALVSSLIVPWPAFVLRSVPGLNLAYRSLMVGLVGESRFDSWNPSTRSGRGSVVERLYATGAAAKMALDHPLLGIGLDQFRKYYVPGEYKPPEARLDLISAHTFWPEIAAELGIPALALIIFLLAAALLGLWRVYRAPPDGALRVLAATLMAALVAWLVVATTFDVDLYRDWRKMASDIVMIAVIVAAAFAVPRLAQERRDSGIRGKRDSRPAWEPLGRDDRHRSGRRAQERRRAIASISMRPPFGSAPTAKVERAGGGSGTNPA